MHRRQLITAAAAGAIAPAALRAQELPKKTITIVVGFAAGGAADHAARVVAKKLGENLGQTVVIDNKAGAGGNIAHQFVARGEADGSVILLGSVGPLAIAPHMMKVGYDPVKDLAPLTMGMNFPNVLVVPPSLGVKSFAELIALARRQPGNLNYGSTGAGSASHLAGELFADMARIDIVHIPFKGGAPALNELLAGRLSMYFATMSTAGPHITAGKLLPLATTGTVRAPFLPELPTVAESLPGFTATNWYAFIASARTPPAILERWNQELVKALKAPEVADELTRAGLLPAPGTRDELARYIERESATWGKVIADRKITADKRRQRGMHATVARCLITVVCAGSLAGCGALHRYLQNWPAGQGAPAVEPALQQQLARLHADGADALADNRLDDAIATWRQYTHIAPPRSPQALTLRGYVTLLERESARRFARQVAAGERLARPAVESPLHVALFPLQSLGPNAARDSFNRALLAMITTDLMKVPALTVLERERVDALLREKQLAASGLVDPATLAGTARLLGAGSVVAGAVYNETGSAGPGSGRYKINTAVSAVADGRVVGAQEADGRQADFFRLEKEIVHGILKALDVRDIPPSVDQVHTRSWAAYARFAAGLALLAEDRFDDAKKAFGEALAIDPAFALAEQALLDTPAKAATVDQIRAELQVARR